MEINKNQKNKVFFITSNLTSIDKNINYSLSNDNSKTNLEKTVEYKRENFTTNVFYFEINPEKFKLDFYIFLF